MLIGGLNRDKQQMTDCFYFRPPQNGPINSPSGQEDFLCRPEKLESPRIVQTTYSVAKVNNLAVLTGGLLQAATDEVHAFIPSLDIWQQMAPMSHARFLHCSAAMDGYLVRREKNKHSVYTERHILVCCRRNCELRTTEHKVQTFLR